MITPERAFQIASQWGSYVSAGDQGTCFYSFPKGDGRPVSEGHREACIAYTIELLHKTQAREPSDERDVDRSNLIALLFFFSQEPPREMIETEPSQWK